MSKTLTPRELLMQNPSQVSLKPAPRIDGDLPLEGKNMDWVKTAIKNVSFQGIEVIDSEGQTLGFLSREILLDYIKAQLLSSVSRSGRMGGNIGQLGGETVGGNIGQLGGDTQTEAHLFRCNLHTPPDEILMAIFRPNLLKCSICGKTMQRFE